MVQSTAVDASTAVDEPKPGDWVAGERPSSFGFESLNLLPETALEPDGAFQTSMARTNITGADLEATPERGVPLRIVIPAIELEAPVTPIGLKEIVVGGQTYFQWQVPGERAAGRDESSARLGKSGNTVLNGHHNVFGEVFRHLVDLKEGDEILIYDSAEVYTYRVTMRGISRTRGIP